MLSAIGDPEAVIARAEELREAGDIQLALHVIDLVANGHKHSNHISNSKLLPISWFDVMSILKLKQYTRGKGEQQYV